MRMRKVISFFINLTAKDPLNFDQHEKRPKILNSNFEFFKTRTPEMNDGTATEVFKEYSRGGRTEFKDCMFFKY